MRKCIVIVLLIFAATKDVQAQTAEDSVKIVITKLFTAMYESDGEGVRNCFADSSILQTITRNAKGETLVRSEQVSGFVAAVSSLPKAAAEERIVFGIVKADAQLAIAWTPYQFYMNGTFSHCGVNSFQLVRLNGQWKIQYIIDTRRKQDCQ